MEGDRAWVPSTLIFVSYALASSEFGEGISTMLSIPPPARENTTQMSNPSLESSEASLQQGIVIWRKRHEFNTRNTLVVREEPAVSDSSFRPNGFVSQDQCEIHAFILGQILVMRLYLHPAQPQIQRQRQDLFATVVIGGDLMSSISWNGSWGGQKEHFDLRLDIESTWVYQLNAGSTSLVY
jgi:hypothetical protein